MEKDSKYAFRVNKGVKDKFKMYCKVMNISPSDILSDIMIEFNRDAEKIIKMKSVDELQEMLEGKYAQGVDEINSLKADKM